MKLLSMTASFGRLDRAKLDCTDGLNLIQLPNEGGKSTWCAFLRAMFYGIPTSQRDKTGFIAEKNRYQPWSGAPLEGTMTVTWQGQIITLRRFAKGNIPFGGFEAVYADTQRPVPGLTGENCGETLLGAGRDVFERTAFLGQGVAKIDGAPELETRIAALCSAGEEDVSFSKTDRRLRDWRNARMANKAVGTIPKKEAELEAVSQRLAQLEQAEGTAQRARAELAALAVRQQELSGEQAYHNAVQGKERRARYEALASTLKTAQTEEATLRAELTRYGTIPNTDALRAAQGELTYLTNLEVDIKRAVNESGSAETVAREARTVAVDPLWQDMTPDEAQRQVDALRARPVPRWGKPARILVWILLSLVLAGAALWAVVQFGTPWQARLISPLLAVGLSTASFFLFRPKKRGAVDAAELDDRLAAFRTRWAAALVAQERADFMAEQVATLSQSREEKLKILLDFVSPFAPDATDSVSLSVALSRALTLEDKLDKAVARSRAAQEIFQAVSAEGVPPTMDLVNITTHAATPQETAAALRAAQNEGVRLRDILSRAQGEMNTLGDGAMLAAQAGALREEIAVLRGEYDALSCALAALEAANNTLQTRFSPEINRRAGGIFAQLTGGAYEALALGRDFSVQATARGELIPRPHLALSTGTVDQLYLAVRLAVCDLVLAGEEMVPLVLDDALVTFDDTRAMLALDYLKTRGLCQQILLFTCQSRAAQLLGEGEHGGRA